MPPPENEFPLRRVGLRAVAEAAGVSLMTVSLGLRNSPRIRPETQRRVREVADRLGYRPDPELSRLMSRLRPARSSGGVVLAMIDLAPERQKHLHAYDAGVRQGIVRRARQLGYSTSLFSLHQYAGLAHLVRVVRCRGITGALLLPSTSPVVLDPAVDWAGVSVVSVTTSVMLPQFHQVVPNHLHNIRMLVETLQARGARRFGVILSESLHRRTHEIYAMVIQVSGNGEGLLILPDDLPRNAAVAAVLQWLEQRNPDVILGGDLMTRLLKVPLVARRCANREVVALTTAPDRDVPYLDQQPDLIGECAVSHLTGMMHNNETGVPALAQITAIRGVLRQGGARARERR